MAYIRGIKGKNMSDKKNNSGEPSDEDLPLLSSTTPAERKRAFRILFVSLLGLGMGQNLFFAVVPPIARDLGLDEVETSVIFSLSALLWVLSSTYWGRRSDTMGRKPVMMIGLAGFGVSTLGFAAVVWTGLIGLLPLFWVFPLLIFVRAIFGTFGSGTHPASQAYVADRTSKADRAVGVAQLGAAFGLGTVIGPGFAAALTQIHILAPFVAVAVLSFGGMFAIWFFLPERTPPRSKKRWYGFFFGHYSGESNEDVLERTLSEEAIQAQRENEKVEPAGPTLRWWDKRVLPLVVMGVVLAFSQTISMQTIAFFFMDQLKISDAKEAAQLVGVGLMAMAMATLFAQVGLIQRFDLRVPTLLRLGAGVTVLAFVLLVFGGAYGVYVSALALAGLGFGLFRPGLQAMGSLAVSFKDQGAIAGIIGSTAATGHILNPIIGMPLYQIWPEGPYALGAVLMSILFLYAWFHPSIRAMAEEEDDA